MEYVSEQYQQTLDDLAETLMAKRARLAQELSSVAVAEPVVTLGMVE